MGYMALALVVHFVADFLMQSREMGKNKSIYVKVLLQHVGIQFVMFAICFAPFIGIKAAIIFSLCNAAIHALIDWNVWKLYKLSAYKRIITEIRKEYEIKFGEKTWVDDKSLITVTAPELYKEKVQNWKFWEDHWFFATIGFDQMLHMLTLVLLIGVLL